MVLFLARKNDWALVPDVFKHANNDGATPDGAAPEGITSLGGARKALREIDFVEFKNITPEGRPNYECRIKPTIEALNHVVKSLNDPDSQREFLRTQYYRNWIPEITNQFAESFADLKLPIRDICNYDASPEDMVSQQKDSAFAMNDLKKFHPSAFEKSLKLAEEYKKPTTFTDTEKEQITKALKTHWSMLRFVMRFLTVDDEMKRELMLKVGHDAFSIGIGAKAKSIHLEEPTGDKNYALCVGKMVEDAARSIEIFGEKPRFWFFSLFDQIENMRNRYPFLFD